MMAAAAGKASAAAETEAARAAHRGEKRRLEALLLQCVHVGRLNHPEAKKVGAAIGDLVVIERPVATQAVTIDDNRASRLAAALARQGLKTVLAPAAVGAGAGEMTVVIDRYIAVAPPCPNWTQRPAGTTRSDRSWHHPAPPVSGHCRQTSSWCPSPPAPSGEWRRRGSRPTRSRHWPCSSSSARWRRRM